MNISRRHLQIQKLLGIIGDYENYNGNSITDNSIDKWLSQFDIADQPTILEEITNLMQTYYFSKKRIKRCLRRFLEDYIFVQRTPEYVLPRIKFLNIQKRGSSQKKILALIGEILREDYGLSLQQSATEDIDAYIYVDDAIYTGNKLRYDLTDSSTELGWLTAYAKPNTVLIIYTFAAHASGSKYAMNYIRTAAKNKSIQILQCYDTLINDDYANGGSIQVLWPETITNNVYIDQYIASLSGTSYRLFRSEYSIAKEALFSSAKARNTIERAFLIKGSQIVSFSEKKAPSMRPLGYKKLESLGFGTFFITYMNIANNCPLVLWWGDSQASSWHPLSKWQPLFYRKVNEYSS